MSPDFNRKVLTQVGTCSVADLVLCIRRARGSDLEAVLEDLQELARFSYFTSTTETVDEHSTAARISGLLSGILKGCIGGFKRMLDVRRELKQKSIFPLAQIHPFDVRLGEANHANELSLVPAARGGVHRPHDIRVDGAASISESLPGYLVVEQIKPQSGSSFAFWYSFL